MTATLATDPIQVPTQQGSPRGALDVSGIGLICTEVSFASLTSSFLGRPASQEVTGTDDPISAGGCALISHGETYDLFPV